MLRWNAEQNREAERAEAGGLSVRVGVLLVLALVQFATANAGEPVELVRGMGTPVCEAYVKAARKWKVPSVGCLADLSLDAPNISRVTGPIKKIEFTYDEDDATAGLRASAGEFARRHDVNLVSYFSVDSLQDWHGSAEQMDVAKQGVRNKSKMYFSEPVVRLLTVDIDNDGKNDSIYFYPHCAGGASESSSITMSSPMILSEDGALVDAERTWSVLRSPIGYKFDPKPRKRPDGAWTTDADVYRQSAYCVLKFGNRIYYDFFWDTRADRIPTVAREDYLRLFLAENDIAREVCAIRLEPVPGFRH